MIKYLLLSGQVQGVGFRYWTKRQAKSLGLSGYVRNLNDGRVEMFVKGKEKMVNQLIELIKEKGGPMLAEVNEIETAAVENSSSIENHPEGEFVIIS